MKLSEAVKILREAGVPDALYDARALYETFGGLSRTELFGNDPDVSSEKLSEAVHRRAEREPLQYIIGEVGFYRETYRVTPDCLIPREDTELLVDTAVHLLSDGAKFLDLCTGSGCVAISTLKNTKSTTATAVDISHGALLIARENAAINGVSDRLKLLEYDVLNTPAPSERYDAILSNPPYVKDDVYPTLEDEIFHEPRAAFVGGTDGGDFYRTITSKYKSLLSEGGFIAYEIGYDQSELITEVARDNGMSAEIVNDLSGRPRVAILRLAR